MDQSARDRILTACWTSLVALALWPMLTLFGWLNGMLGCTLPILLVAAVIVCILLFGAKKPGAAVGVVAIGLMLIGSKWVSNTIVVGYVASGVALQSVCRRVLSASTTSRLQLIRIEKYGPSTRNGRTGRSVLYPCWNRSSRGTCA